jgi:hypothetical protein
VTGFVDIGWETLVAVLAVVVVGGLLILMLLARDPPSRRIRFGVFLEREQLDDDGEPKPPSDASRP